MVAVARETAWGHGWAIGALGAIIAAAGLVFAGRFVAGWIVTGVGVVAPQAPSGPSAGAVAPRR